MEDGEKSTVLTGQRAQRSGSVVPPPCGGIEPYSTAPFLYSVHRQDQVPYPSRDRCDEIGELFDAIDDMTDAEVRIADATLDAGYALSIVMSEGVSVNTTARLVSRLGRRTCARWEENGKRLILWRIDCERESGGA